MKEGTDEYTSTNLASLPPEKQELKEILLFSRVIIRNSVYVTGLPLEILSERLLKSDQFFGQYGEIWNLTLLWNKSECRRKSIFVQFSSIEQACLSILCVNGLRVNNCKIKASFGMKRFCWTFIYENRVCSKPLCGLYHDIPKIEDIQFGQGLQRKTQRVKQGETKDYFIRNQYHLSSSIQTLIEQSKPWGLFPSPKQALKKIISYLNSTCPWVQSEFFPPPHIS